MEILAPVKDLEQAKEAFASGASSLYAGIKAFCRWQDRAISFSNFLKILDYSKAVINKKTYAALNQVPCTNRTKEYFEILKLLVIKEIDGVILNDIGLIRQVRSRFPKLFIISSIGVAPLNIEEVKFLKEIGVQRIVLPEDTTMRDIIMIKQNLDIELEMFSEESLANKCFTFTGKCYISSYYRQYLNDAGFLFGSAKRSGCHKICRNPFSFENKTLYLDSFLDKEKTTLKEVFDYLEAIKIKSQDGNFSSIRNQIKSLRKMTKHMSL